MTEILMIGIGGTGIKTLSHIKSQLKGGNKEGEIPLHVKLLGIDTTNVPDRVQGVDEKLNEDSEFVFRVGDLSEFFNNKAVQLNWFRMNYYRNHPQKDTLLSMGKGAGMHRQIGRLAFHNMLEAGRASPLYRKIFEVFTGFNDTNVDVLVFGSLAGGSGASMVVDIPYLIRNIAKNIRPSKTAHLYGFFALPDAFLHTKGVTVDDNMQARSVAALRELYRFNSISNAEIGFNFNYIPDDTVLSFRSEGGAYKQIYIFDERDKTPQGEDPKNPLDIDIAHGVCATMSSYAWIFADPISINIDNAIANRTVPLGELSKSYNGYNPPVCASFGSFSYVLPIGKLVDSWRYQFGQEIVNELLPCDAEGRFLKNRAGGRFSGEGANSVISVIENKLTEIKGVISDIKSLGFASTPQSYKDGFENNVQQIINRRTGDLQNALLSGVKLSEDDEKKFDGMLDDDCYFCKSKPGMLGKSIIQLDQGSLVNLEDIRANANNKKETAAKLISNCNTALISKVNEWEPIIDQKVANIYTTYKTWLLQFAKDTLNGVKEDSPENAIENKAGKPGWLFGFLEELRKDQIGLKTILESAIEKCNRAINDIEAEIGVSKGNKSNFIDQLEKKPNETNQKMYISKQQEILENRRKIMLIEGELAAVTKMEELTKKMLDEVDCFINLLRIDSEENLQKTLKSRQNEIDTNRTDAGILNSVRKIIKDEEWEQTKYNEFTQTVDSYRSKPSQRILKDIKWDSEVKEVSVERAGEEVKVDNVSIKLHIRGFTLTEIGNLRTDEIEPFDDNEERKGKEDKVKAAADKLAARCQEVFAGAWEKFTVLDYLADKYNRSMPWTPTDFADEVANKVGPLLKGANTQRQTIRFNYYLCPNNNQPDPVLRRSIENWKGAVKATLSNLLRETGDNQQPFWPHSDPTTFSVISYVDLVDFQEIPSYTSGKSSYTDQNRVLIEPPALSRPLLHVFPADQNACKYDLPDQDDVDGLLDAKIVNLFEDPNDLDHFIDGLIWGFIKKTIRPCLIDSTRSGQIYSIVLPPLENELDQFSARVTNEYIGYLNKPDKYEGGLLPSLLEAAETFCLMKKTINSQDSSCNLQTMDDFKKRLAKHVDMAIRKEMEKNLSQWKAGQGEPIDLKIAQMPDSLERDSKLRNRTEVIIRRNWCRAIGASRQSEIAKIYDQFEQARTTNDEDRVLEKFTISEKQFINQVVEKKIFQSFQTSISSLNTNI